MTDWDPDYGQYYDDMMHEDTIFGPYEDEGYTGEPIPYSNTRVGNTHHPDCPGPNSWECCKELWQKDYDIRKEKELEERHEELWQ